MGARGEVEVGGVLINDRAGKLNGVYRVERFVDNAEAAVATSEQRAEGGSGRNSHD
jgi:hypothetical protein